MTSRLKARLLAQRALLQRLQSSKKRSALQSGFTLIELLIVIIIIGILAAIAIPNFLSQRDRGYQASARSWASGEARKCGASLAATNSNSDYSPSNPPSSLGNVTVAPTTPTQADCAGGATYTVTLNGNTSTWTVGSSGSVTQTGS